MSRVHHHQSPAAVRSASHGSLKGYTVGFLLSVALTVLAFWLVMSGAVPHAMILPGIVVLGVAQLLVQLVFFLHMGSAPEQRDNLAIFVFTAVIIAIIVCGSLWVLHNMNANMMMPTPPMPTLHDS